MIIEVQQMDAQLAAEVASRSSPVDQKDSSGLMRIGEVSERIGVPVDTLRGWRHGDGPRSARLGRRVVCRAADVESRPPAQWDPES